MFGLMKTPKNSPRDLTERVERLERWKREMMLEWENVYDKIYKAASRASRARRDEAPASGDPEPSKAAEPAPTAQEQAFWSRRATKKGAFRAPAAS